MPRPPRTRDFYVYNAILSRSTVFEFKSVEPKEVERAVIRAAELLSKEQDIEITLEDGCAAKIATGCGGDVRKAMNALELSAIATDCVDGKKHILASTAEALSQKSAMRYDRDGDEHYDIVSAYQKSMRGSDPDAALHYLGRLPRREICRPRAEGLWSAPARTSDLPIRRLSRL